MLVPHDDDELTAGQSVTKAASVLRLLRYDGTPDSMAHSILLLLLLLMSILAAVSEKRVLI